MSPTKLSIQNGCAEGMGSTLNEVQVQSIPGGAIHPVTSYPVGHARFLPEKMAHWTVCTAFALAAAIAVGIAIPCLVESVVQMLPGGVEVEEQPWVRSILFVWYALFVLLVVCPFAVFWTWSRLCRSRPVASERQHWPKVSILIPAFNEQEMILDAIHGALSQDYPDVEVIVIDDGSTDLTPYLAATQPVRLIRKARNAGKAAALNSGLEVAQGEVIITCDADGYLDPRAARHLVLAFSDPQVAGVAGQVRLFQPDGLLRGQGLECLACFSVRPVRGAA
ncbi:MAG TPA: glycosyltransferase [Gemmataceae bacterium]